MNSPKRTHLSRALFGFYLLFALGSAISISIAQIALGGATFLFIIESLRTRHNPLRGPVRWVYLLMTLYLLWMILASFLNDNTADSLGSLADSWLFLAVPVGVYVMQNTDDRRRIVQTFAVAVLVIALYGIVQHYTGLLVFRPASAIAPLDDNFRAQGAFTHSLTYANYVSVAAVTMLAAVADPRCGFSKGFSWLAQVAALLAIVAAVLSFSRGPVAALVVMVLVLAVTRPGRRTISLAVTLGILVAAIFCQSPSAFERIVKGIEIERAERYYNSRLHIWSRSFDLVKDHPITGVGPGNFPDAYRATLPERLGPRFVAQHAHNDPLHIAAVAGIPASLLWGLLWLAILVLAWQGGRRPWANRPEAPAWNFAMLMGSITFLMTSLTEATFFDEEVRHLAMFIWALGLADWYNHYRAARASGKTT